VDPLNKELLVKIG